MHLCPASNYLFKVNYRNTIAKCEICSKLTIKSAEGPHWHRSDVFIVNFEHFTPCSSISIVNFAKENVGWVWAA